MKRRRRGSTGGSLDSLLDTMTNVVGILVILLVVTQLGVGDAVKRIKGFVTQVSAEELLAAKKQAKEIDELLKQQNESLKLEELGQPKIETDLEQLKKLLEQLKRELKTIEDSQTDPDKVRREVEARKKRIKQLEQQIQSRQGQVAKLKAQLDDTPEAGPGPAAKVINLPNPRAAPKGATPVVFVCRNGRVLPFNLETLQQRAQKVMVRWQRVLVRPDGVDCKALVQLFEQEEIRNNYFRIKIKIVSNKPYMVLHHREDGGETVEKIRSKDSLFQQAVRSLDKNKNWVRFMVWHDSFDAYLQARQIVHDAGLLAGWIPYDPNYEWRVDLGVKLACSTGKPPVKKPPAKKPPTKKPPTKKPPTKKPPTKKPTPKPKPRPPVPVDEID